MFGVCQTSRGGKSESERDGMGEKEEDLGDKRIEKGERRTER
jgi:hypothetical protein